MTVLAEQLTKSGIWPSDVEGSEGVMAPRGL